MRNTDKATMTNQFANEVFGVDFHDFIQREQASANVELAEEFGISMNSVRHLKRKLGRS